jgi:hypothetical protein
VKNIFKNFTFFEINPFAGIVLVVESTIIIIIPSNHMFRSLFFLTEEIHVPYDFRDHHVLGGQSQGGD